MSDVAGEESLNQPANPGFEPRRIGAPKVLRRAHRFTAPERNLAIASSALQVPRTSPSAKSIETVTDFVH